MKTKQTKRHSQEMTMLNLNWTHDWPQYYALIQCSLVAEHPVHCYTFPYYYYNNNNNNNNTVGVVSMTSTCVDI